MGEDERRGGAPLALVFSSTCATYGIHDPEQIPIAKNFNQRPINLYGRSEWMVEQLIADFADANGLVTTICDRNLPPLQRRGCRSGVVQGKTIPPESHLIQLVFDAMSGSTPLAAGIDDDDSTPGGTGYSMQQVIDTAKRLPGLARVHGAAPLWRPACVGTYAKRTRRELDWTTAPCRAQFDHQPRPAQTPGPTDQLMQSSVPSSLATSVAYLLGNEARCNRPSGMKRMTP